MTVSSLTSSAVLAASNAQTDLHKVAAPEYSQYLRSYLTVFFLAAAAIVLVGGTLGLSRLVRPRNPNREKLEAYESGVDPLCSS
jgi:hypothetical protein